MRNSMFLCLGVCFILLTVVLFAAAPALGAFHALIYLPGILGTDLRNKIGNVVASKNRYGNFFRNKTTPKNPKTVKQLAVRDILKTVSQSWRNLSQAQMIAWNDYAMLFTYHDQIGRPYHLSGEAMYNKLNAQLGAIGVTSIPAIPDRNHIPASMTGFTVDVNTTPGNEDIELNLPGAIAATSSLIVRSTGIISKGVFYFKGFRQFAVLTSAFVSGSSIKTQYLAEFGAMPVTGDKVVFEVVNVDNRSGFATAPIQNVAFGTI
jgi:hypothetical protein